MLRLHLTTPPELLRKMGARARALREHRKMSRVTLCERADVGYSSLQRFEKTGRASTALMIRVAFALNVHEPFEDLFMLPEARTITDFVAKNRDRPKNPGRSK